MDPGPSERIRTALAQIAVRYPATLQPPRKASQVQVRIPPSASMPVGAHVLDVRAVARSRLVCWSAMVLRGRDLRTRLDSSQVGSMCAFLSRHADWLAVQDVADQVTDQLQDSAQSLEAIADPKRRDWLSLGSCPLTVLRTDGTEQSCPGTIRAYPGRDPYCDRCRVQAVVPWWEAKMFGGTGLANLLTAAELVDVIHAEFGRNVKESAIRQWVTRGLIQVKGKDSQGRSLFDRVDVVCSLTIRAVIN